MLQEYRLIPRASDDQVIRFFERLESELRFRDINLYVLGSSNQIPLSANSPVLEQIRAAEGYAIIRCGGAAPVTATGVPQVFSVIFERGGRSEATGSVQRSLYVDNISFANTNYAEPLSALAVHKIIDEEFLVPSRLELPLGDGSAISRVLDSHHEVISRIERQIADLGARQLQKGDELQAAFDARKEQIGAELEAEEQRLHEAHEARLKEVEAAKATLDARAKEIDDKSNTHARREIRQKLKEDFKGYKERFELTLGTRRLRWPVILTVIVIEVVVAGLLYLSLTGGAPEGDFWNRLPFWLKSFGLTLLAAGTALWFLKWQNAWAARHADSEFQLRQMELDMDRASWVVETALEWRFSQGGPMPRKMLEAISRNLFTSGEARGEADSPADHLASALLGEASVVRLKAGEHELELGRKGLANLRKMKDEK